VDQAGAGPVFGDRVTLTNLGWSFSISDLHRSLGLGSLKVVNDFAATAMAVPHLPGADVFPVGPRTPEAAGPIGIIGPGTGLGVSALMTAEWISRQLTEAYGWKVAALPPRGSISLISVKALTFARR
jgi:glucokinase